jgi:hypothetical protein
MLNIVAYNELLFFLLLNHLFEVQLVAEGQSGGGEGEVGKTTKKGRRDEEVFLLIGIYTGNQKR